MKYFYQTVTVDINDEITYVGDFYSTRELAVKAIERYVENDMAEDWKGWCWHSCRHDVGSRQTIYDTVELIKQSRSVNGVTTRHGIITHKMFEM